MSVVDWICMPFYAVAVGAGIWTLVVCAQMWKEDRDRKRGRR